MTHVLDASALLALALGEDGAQRVATFNASAVISHVNVAEAVTVLTRRGVTDQDIHDAMSEISLPIFGGSEALAIEVGLLFRNTQEFGLSLGDRFCLALALRLDASLVTSDRRLAEAADRSGAVTLLFR